jgi:hypothetical protein
MTTTYSRQPKFATSKQRENNGLPTVAARCGRPGSADGGVKGRRGVFDLVFVRRPRQNPPIEIVELLVPRRFVRQVGIDVDKC